MLSLDQTLDFFEGLMNRTATGGYWHTFERLLNALRRRRVRGAFAGALALNAHGIERSTRDIDYLVSSEDKDELVEELLHSFELSQDYDTLLVLRDSSTGTEVHLLVPFDSISTGALSDAEPARVRGRKVRVVTANDLAAMKVIAAVDNPASESKQRADIELLIRHGKIDLKAVARLLIDEAGQEYARLFKSAVERVKATAPMVPPRRRVT
jgi:hypothetical protein